MCEGGFLSSSVEIQLAITCLTETFRKCRELEGESSKYAHREIRFNKDEVYRESMISLLRKRLPTIRGALRTKAGHLIKAAYQIGSLTGEDAIKAHIAKLTTAGAYTFLDHNNPVNSRDAVYRNPAIIDLIGQEWFTGPTSAAVRYHELFNPLPLPLIALACAALECALKDYSSGTRGAATANMFQEPIYRPVVKKHLHNLNTIANGSPEVLKAIQSDIYSKCWRETSLAFEEDDAPMELFIDISQL
ncbi:hypothetical protein SISNIDRAFT_489800 [Sistotremastrum niveocremeum HHB9708]|uniref:DUF6532 domain-containing protein n=1 Tax=Sistotremastrum niveocremeum HHB9708 TaxID=1314777 RepID=A0A164PIR2_9AGAM|nr:hypothetical protein SISNIDRAFT_489800 [Sistotremastrum niveocremeum HHB9708]